MSATRRTILAAAGAGLASLGGARTIGTSPPGDGHSAAHDVAMLTRLSEESNAALLRGDVDRYRALVPLAEDFTLMSPFGGPPTKGAVSVTDEQWEAMKRFFRNGTLEVEPVQSYWSADLVVLVLIERARVEVGELPAQPWGLRVTLVYRRERAGWRLAHRHADPLADGITLDQAAALARGAA